jgi:hypothetical protein
MIGGLTYSLPSHLQAQRDAQADCRAVLGTLSSDALRRATRPEKGCQDLAVYLGDTLAAVGLTAQLKSRVADDSALKLTPRKLQSVRSREANISGVPGQSDAVPSAQPTGLASANISAAGTDDGTKTVAAISLNPMTLFGGTDTIAAARWSRLADLTILVPVGNESSSVDRLGYFGIRGRVNFTGLEAGDQLLKNVGAAFANAVGAEAALDLQLIQAFESFPDSATIARCAAAVFASSYGDSPDACLGKVTIGLDNEDYEAIHRSIQVAREKADARYLGLDLRFDTGDPTLSGDPIKEADALQVGLAFGRRSLTPNPQAVMFGIQGRLGVRYSDPKTESDSVVWSVDGAVGFEASRLTSGDAPVRLATGIEFRYANKSDAIAERQQTDNLVLRGALGIPIVGGTSVTVAFTGPLVGEVSPTLSVNFNWGLLMSNLAGASSP